MYYFVPICPSILPPHSFAGFPEIHLVFGCGSLHLSPSAARWRFSDDSWARHQFGVPRIILAYGKVARDVGQDGYGTQGRKFSLTFFILIIILFLLKIDFYMIYSGYSFSSPNSSQINPTSPPIQLHILSFF